MAKTKKEDQTPKASEMKASEVKDAQPEAPAVDDDLAAQLEAKTKEADELATALDKATSELQLAQDKLAEMKERMGQLRMTGAAPRTMTHDEVKKEIGRDPQAAFHVAKPFQFMGSTMEMGRKIRAHHYPQILSYVKAGLQLTPATIG